MGGAGGIAVSPLASCSDNLTIKTQKLNAAGLKIIKSRWKNACVVSCWSKLGTPHCQEVYDKVDDS